MDKRDTNRNSSDDPSAPPVPLRHPVRIYASGRSGSSAFDLRPDAGVRARIAAFLGVDGISALRFKGALVAEADDAWQARGRLTARIMQTCVVTLEPIERTIDRTVERLYLPEEALGAAAELDIVVDTGEDGPDDPDTYTNEIDPGALALEVLALEIDPYPRGDEAEDPVLVQTAPPGIAPLQDADLRPFAGLAALRDALRDEGT